ncbi:MAG TPA: glutamate racemase, partial [Microlunatus sp.]
DALAVASQVEVFTAACPKFVPFVEAGITGGPDLLAAAEDYLTPLQAADIDTLILGCTHYPLLTGVLSMLLGDGVSLVSSADECAKELYAVLAKAGLTHDVPRQPTRRFLTTGDPESFSDLGRRLVPGLITDVDQFSGGLRWT